MPIKAMPGNHHGPRDGEKASAEPTASAGEKKGRERRLDAARLPV